MTDISSLRYARIWYLIGWTMVLAVFYVSLDPSPPDLSEIQNGDKIAHTASYFALMFWFGQLCAPANRWKYMASFIVMGVGIEFLQGFSGYRTFDTWDMLANSVGALLGGVLSMTGAAQLIRKFEVRLAG